MKSLKKIPEAIRLCLKPSAAGHESGGIEEILYHRRLDHNHIKDAIEFINIFFPFSDQPVVIVEAGGAGVLIETGAFPNIIDGAEGLLSLLPEFQNWLDDWAASPGRAPRLDPEWAAHRGILQQSVRAISIAILSIARSEISRLQFLACNGELRELKIPPKASLCLPRPPSATNKPVITVGDGRWFDSFSSPSGAIFLRPKSSREDQSDTVGSVLRINPRRGARKIVLRRAKLRALQVENEANKKEGEKDD